MCKKIAVITDMDIGGSGYKNLSVPLLEGLVEKGHEVKIAGLQYAGQEHWWNFSIIPAQNLQDADAIIKNLAMMWKFDVLIVLLDIPLQERILQSFQERNYKYIGIFPIEAPPLCTDWAMVLAQMDKALVISEFGAEEAQKLGIDAEYLQVGIDLETWIAPTPEDRNKMRNAFGIDEDTTVILTVADNQERKNLSRSIEIVADFVYDRYGVNQEIIEKERLEPVNKVQYILVTREHFWGGWKVRSYAQELGINNQFTVIERGVPFSELIGLYSMADVFLLTSKSEGLGFPVLEAMAMKLPVVATNFAGMAEHLQGGKNGFPLDFWWPVDDPERYRDPFGNGLRVFAKRKHGYITLKQISYNDVSDVVQNAFDYVKGRTHQISINQLQAAIEGLYE